MKIGILKCDSVQDRFLHIAGDYEEMFIKSFQQEDPSLTFQTFDVRKNIYPEPVDQCNAYLITGSARSVYEPLPWILTLSEYIRNMNEKRIKTLGICFGHQLIAHALGGSVAKSSKGWGVGVTSVNISVKEKWMKPWQDKVSLIYSHQDQIEELPPGGILLGATVFCPFSLYRVGEHILCVQGHPEFQVDYSKALFLSRSSVIDEKRLSLAIQSLESKTDHSVLVQWMIEFLQSDPIFYERELDLFFTGTSKVARRRIE